MTEDFRDIDERIEEITKNPAFVAMGKDLKSLSPGQHRGLKEWLVQIKASEVDENDLEEPASEELERAEKALIEIGVLDVESDKDER
jgi:hypothetical protein